MLILDLIQGKAEKEAKHRTSWYYHIGRTKVVGFCVLSSTRSEYKDHSAESLILFFRDCLPLGSGENLFNYSLPSRGLKELIISINVNVSQTVVHWVHQEL